MATVRIAVSLPPGTLKELDRRAGSRSAEVARAIEATAKASPAAMAKEIAKEIASRLLPQLPPKALERFTRSARQISERIIGRET